MKLVNIDNPEELMEVINQCVGTVELVTPEGDRLNLKSKLCQYITLTSIFTSATKIPEIELIAHEKEDVDRLLAYMMKI
jgi:hypothetical protein